MQYVVEMEIYEDLKKISVSLCMVRTMKQRYKRLIHSPNPT
jgi:hypothetical protein